MTGVFAGSYHLASRPPHADKKENKMFPIYKQIQKGAVAKSYMRKGFLINEEMRKYLVIYSIFLGQSLYEPFLGALGTI